MWSRRTMRDGKARSTSLQPRDRADGDAWMRPVDMGTTYRLRSKGVALLTQWSRARRVQLTADSVNAIETIAQGAGLPTRYR